MILMRKWELYYWIPLGILTVISAILNRFYYAFSIVTIICILGVVASYCVNRSIYLKDLKKRYDDELEQYLIELLNKRLISRKQYEEKDPEIVLGYYQDYKTAKTKHISIMVILSIVAISIGYYFIIMI